MTVQQLETAGTGIGVEYSFVYATEFNNTTSRLWDSVSGDYNSSAADPRQC